ncbi:glycerophosphodiester phosphodiesterase [Patescibacteria group bacterium]|nr:glycerophosphodiester phosphodiesterase [Patescibacteria group bacterium]
MTLIIGHRGACGYAPENTLLSFQKAIDLGCNGTELDVHLTKDGEVVVIHDEKVDRTTDGHGYVSGMTLDELKKLNCEEGQKIPTLQEVIDLCKGKINLYIELKGKKTAKPVNEIILKNNLTDDVRVSSFDIDMIKEIKTANPNLKVSYLIRKYSKNIWKFALSIPLDSIGFRYNLVKKRRIKKAHELGLECYAWKILNKKIGDKVIKKGIDAICTNFPKDYL